MCSTFAAAVVVIVVIGVVAAVLLLSKTSKAYLCYHCWEVILSRVLIRRSWTRPRIKLECDHNWSQLVFCAQRRRRNKFGWKKNSTKKKHFIFIFALPLHLNMYYFFGWTNFLLELTVQIESIASNCKWYVRNMIIYRMYVQMDAKLTIANEQTLPTNSNGENGSLSSNWLVFLLRFY